jgi:hypothetical protein
MSRILDFMSMKLDDYENESDCDQHLKDVDRIGKWEIEVQYSSRRPHALASSP